jgi:hypothetical protein
LGNQILHKTDLKLVEEGPKIIILKSDISAIETRYQCPDFFDTTIPYHKTIVAAISTIKMHISCP